MLQLELINRYHCVSCHNCIIKTGLDLISIFFQAVGQSASYAPSEQVSDYFDAVMGDDYTASVDIDDLVQIADAGSVSSGSMASFIDWDQVDDLIADVS